MASMALHDALARLAADNGVGLPPTDAAHGQDDTLDLASMDQNGSTVFHDCEPVLLRLSSELNLDLQSASSHVLNSSPCSIDQPVPDSTPLHASQISGTRGVVSASK